MSPRLIAFAGPAGCGKTTASEILLNNGFERVKFAGALKAMMRAFYDFCGLEPAEIEARIEGNLKESLDDLLGAHTPRYAMQTLGTDWGRDKIYAELWVNSWSRAVENLLSQGTAIVTDDCRFQNEADAIRAAGGMVIKIEGREPGTSNDGHPSEKFDFEPDVVIYNTGSVAEFERKILMMFASNVQKPIMPHTELVIDKMPQETTEQLMRSLEKAAGLPVTMLEPASAPTGLDGTGAMVAPKVLNFPETMKTVSENLATNEDDQDFGKALGYPSHWEDEDDRRELTQMAHDTARDFLKDEDQEKRDYVRDWLVLHDMTRVLEIDSDNAREFVDHLAVYGLQDDAEADEAEVAIDPTITPDELNGKINFLVRRGPLDAEYVRTTFLFLNIDHTRTLDQEGRSKLAFLLDCYIAGDRSSLDTLATAFTGLWNGMA